MSRRSSAPLAALLCAVAAEADILRSSIANPKPATVGSATIIEGTIGELQVLLCIGGMGKVNAAHAATLLLTRYAPEVILVFGIGGAYPGSGAQVGDLAVAQEEVAGDDGVLTAQGFRDTEFMGIPLVRTESATLFNAFPAPSSMVERVRRLLLDFRHPGSVLAGRFVTLSTCSGTSERADELVRRLKGLCENMEGAAVAQVAALHGVPWLEVRGISNMVEERDLSRWDIPKAAAAVQHAVLHLLKGWHDR